MRIWCWMILLCLPLLSFSQKKWDGGSGSKHWMDAENWFPDGVPVASDTVILDNSIIKDNYQVYLPAGNQKIECLNLSILPSPGTEIRVEIPSSSTANPALFLSDAKEGLSIGQGGVFINSSTASSGNPLQLNGKIKILNNGRFIHRTIRGNAELTTRLSTAAGTEYGIVEFDIPGQTPSSVSLTGKTFGSLVFSSTTNSKIYQASGTTDCKIRGDLIINKGSTFNNTLIADLILYGDLHIYGILALNPASNGQDKRSIIISGTNSVWHGDGSIEMGPFFRNIEIAKKASLTLNRSLELQNESNKCIIYGTIQVHRQFPITGNGSFDLMDGGGLHTNTIDGLCISCSTNAIQVKQQRYSNQGRYYFSAIERQHTGLNLPDTVGSLYIQNQGGVILDRPVYIRDSLILVNGIFFTDNNTVSVNGNKIGYQTPNTFISGTIIIRLTDTKPHIIPIGDEKCIAPIMIKSVTTNEVHIPISYLFAHHPDPDLAYNYWELKTPASDKKIFLGSIPQKKDSILGIGAIETWISNGGSWVLADTKLITLDNQTILENKNALSGRIKLTIGQQKNHLLPVEKVTITGKRENGKVKLWLSVIGNGSMMYIQRSYNGLDFISVDSLYVQSANTQSIAWSDTLMINKTTYYRVLFSKGDKLLFSNVLAISGPQIGNVKLYPNPAIEKIFIFSSFPCSNLECTVVNMSGAMIRKVKSIDKSVDIRDLATGSYLLIVTGCDRKFTLPFTKN